MSFPQLKSCGEKLTKFLNVDIDAFASMGNILPTKAIVQSSSHL